MASVTIDLAPDIERKLRATAAQEGQSLELYLQKIAEQAVSSCNGSSATEPRRVSFEELTGPFASAVADAEMTEDEVGTFFEEVLQEVRVERRAAKRSPS